MALSAVFIAKQQIRSPSSSLTACFEISPPILSLVTVACFPQPQEGPVCHFLSLVATEMCLEILLHTHLNLLANRIQGMLQIVGRFLIIFSSNSVYNCISFYCDGSELSRGVKMLRSLWAVWQAWAAVVGVPSRTAKEAVRAGDTSFSAALRWGLCVSQSRWGW